MRDRHTSEHELASYQAAAAAETPEPPLDIVSRFGTDGGSDAIDAADPDSSSDELGDSTPSKPTSGKVNARPHVVSSPAHQPSPLPGRNAFGFIPFVAHRPTMDNKSIELQAHRQQTHASHARRHRTGIDPTLIGNLGYSLFIGLPLFVIYALLGLVLSVTIVGFPWGRQLFKLAAYNLWPYARYLERLPDSPVSSASMISPLSPARAISGRQKASSLQRAQQRRPTSRFRLTVGGALYCMSALPILFLCHMAAAAVSWLVVVAIPMAKHHRVLAKRALPHVLDVVVSSGAPHPGSDVLLFSLSSISLMHRRYTVFGMSIVLVNMLSLAALAICFGYVMPDGFVEENSVAVFLTCLLACIPLAYVIGEAVARVAARTSSAVGAVLNATFGSIIELILYVSAVRNGLNTVVQQAVTGSLLGTMLLMPGLAMMAGGLKHRDQHVNRRAAGVSSTMMLVAFSVLALPSLFMTLYGNEYVTCEACNVDPASNNTECSMCTYDELLHLYTDPIWTTRGQQLQYVCAIALPVMYFLGLLFSLRTHSYIYQLEPEQDPGAEKPDADAEGHVSLGEWTATRCVTILLAATVAFSLVSETLIDSLTPALEAMGIPDEFAGLTIIALVPNTSEFFAACSYALHNNISLSVEIGRAASVQIAMIQVPALVAMGVFLSPASSPFTIVFPFLDLVALFLAVLITNYQSTARSTNWFEGASLLTTYLVILAAFWYAPESTPANIV
jgi:Ca2+:H+ antiporter